MPPYEPPPFHRIGGPLPCRVETDSTEDTEGSRIETLFTSFLLLTLVPASRFDPEVLKACDGGGVVDPQDDLEDRIPPLVFGTKGFILPSGVATKVRDGGSSGPPCGVSGLTGSGVLAPLLSFFLKAEVSRFHGVLGEPSGHRSMTMLCGSDCVRLTRGGVLPVLRGETEGRHAGEVCAEREGAERPSVSLSLSSSSSSEEEESFAFSPVVRSLFFEASAARSVSIFFCRSANASGESFDHKSSELLRG